MSIVEFSSVKYTYPKALAPTINNFTLHLQPGSFHFICGPSGVGKTTLFKMLYMDMVPTGGTLKMFGHDVSTLTREQIAQIRRRMGIVFQDFRLLKQLTVWENVCLPLTLLGPLTPAQEKGVREILDWVGLAGKLDASPDSLSGGEKQRVAIARAVVNRPKLLIADEPTGNVDDGMGKRIMHLLTELHKHGTTVLVATHSQDLVRTFGFPCLSLNASNNQMTRDVA
jgi:cell division transport system ATP-binding protein